jgi:glutathione S-transferase
MKLYFSPGACSLAPHIVAEESGLKLDYVKVDLGKKQINAEGDFLPVNSKGKVPTLQLDNGEYLTEGPAIAQYLADQAPQAGLAPAAGTLARYRLAEWLNYISTELHQTFGPLFKPGYTDEFKAQVKETLLQKFDWVSGQLGDKPYLLGNQFTAADAYLFTVLNWTNFVGMQIPPANLQAFMKRVSERPGVQAALRAEGLLK